MLDVASMHPQLQPHGLSLNYFAMASHLKNKANTALLRVFDASEYASYLVGNTTSGMVSILQAAAQCGCAVSLQGDDSQHYPPYLNLFKNKNISAEWHVHTHLSPVTGVVDRLCRNSAEVLIVDAAQSFGTCLTPQLLQQADVVIAPLHKHVGLVVGLAMVWVKKNIRHFSAMNEILNISQAGCTSLYVLKCLHKRLEKYDSHISNKAMLLSNKENRSWCMDRGLSICGNLDSAPFICLTTINGESVQNALKPGSWKYFKSFNTARFSFYFRGKMSDSPADFSEQFKTEIDGLLKANNKNSN